MRRAKGTSCEATARLWREADMYPSRQISFHFLVPIISSYLVDRGKQGVSHPTLPGAPP